VENSNLFLICSMRYIFDVVCSYKVLLTTKR